MNNQTRYPMPDNMIQSRLDVVQLISVGLNNTQISQITGHTRNFVRQCRSGLQNGTLMVQTERIGRPSIITNDLIQNVDLMTKVNRRMSTQTIVDAMSTSNDLPHPSYGTVWKIRHNLGYKYLPPIDTFFITEEQRQKRLAFAQTNIQ